MKEMVAVTGAPVSETCSGAIVIAYPDMPGPGGITDKLTVLAVEVAGVMVICAEAASPATGCRVSPLAGDKVKSGMATLTEELDALLGA
jgi:hypothetical protein